MKEGWLTLSPDQVILVIFWTLKSSAPESLGIIGYPTRGSLTETKTRLHIFELLPSRPPRENAVSVYQPVTDCAPLRTGHHSGVGQTGPRKAPCRERR